MFLLVVTISRRMIMFLFNLKINSIWKHLRDIVDTHGTTVIITTHYIEEMRHANKVNEFSSSPVIEFLIKISNVLNRLVLCEMVY